MEPRESQVSLAAGDTIVMLFHLEMSAAPGQDDAALNSDVLQHRIGEGKGTSAINSTGSSATSLSYK